MTRRNRLAPRTKTSSPHQARRPSHRPEREARARRSFEGVVASYIRELSAAGDTTPRAGTQARPAGTVASSHSSNDGPASVASGPGRAAPFA
jgi:hypothetical protein